MSPKELNGETTKIIRRIFYLLKLFIKETSTNPIFRNYSDNVYLSKLKSIYDKMTTKNIVLSDVINNNNNLGKYKTIK